MNGNYPPGHPTGNAECELAYKCPNPKCERHGETWVIDGIYERDTGAAYPVDEDDGPMCPACGHEGNNA